MFSRILVANRGEIALRIIRACKELGIETVAVYSQEDKDAIYLRFADETVCIGPGESSKSYLDIPRIISAAEVSDAEAIHPGYGFLSENSHFAEVCESCRIAFIGPTAETMRKVGDKIAARKVARELKIPLLEGSEGGISSDEEAISLAHKIGYPVIVKAAAGGGGRGMRVAHNEMSLKRGLMAARTEAEAAFKDSSVYLERYLERPRHVEIQILADQYGNLVHLGERDCSLQRRHQKIVEESPSPIMNSKLRLEMGEAAKKLLKVVNYSNAGTVEFLVDKNLNFYFMEVNARVQVEHPVTEMVTGIDIIKEQIRLAAGEKLGYQQRQIKIRGAAIECRINAEDPDCGFKPSPGTITCYYPPGGRGVRVDSHIYAGYTVPPLYDSMIAKLIVYQDTREQAIAAMRRALSEYVITGIKTTIPLHLDIFDHIYFLCGDVDTSFIEGYFTS